MIFLTLLLSLATLTNAYWLMATENFITTERIDPVVSPGKVAGHAHSVVGGSNFRFNTNTESLRRSECSSIPIPEDKSAYWFPNLYFQWANGSFTSLDGGAVIDEPGTTTAFPDDFRMFSGDPTLRTYDPNSHAQQAISFLCLDFDGVSTRHESLPTKSCPSGVRAQINFPSCWDGKNLDSPDHKSHVAFPSGGPDSGTCNDPKYPVTIPRIFIEVYWGTNEFENVRSQAMNRLQPFVYSYGDPTGYGYHADFINGWDKGVLQNAVDKCHCNPSGDPTCCVNQGIFHMDHGQTCRITKAIDEITTGTIPKLPGNNPVQPEGQHAAIYPDTSTPNLISPVFAYTGSTPTQTGTIIPVPNPTSGSTTPSPSQVFSTETALTSTISTQSSSSHNSGPSIPSPTVATSSSNTVPGTTSRPLITTPPFPTFSFPTITFPTISLPHFPKLMPGNTGEDGQDNSGYNAPAPHPETSHQTGINAPSPSSSSSSGGSSKCHPRSRGPSRYRRVAQEVERFDVEVNASESDAQPAYARDIPLARVHRRYLSSRF